MSDSHTSSLVLVSVGNTRTRFARSTHEQVEPSTVLAGDDHSPAAEAQAIAALGDTAVIATTSRPRSDALVRELAERGVSVQCFGEDLPIPIINSLDDDTTVGQDRLLDALGAFARSKQACVVIDAGTAITVDFVDGEGVFHGGAIAPGLRMMCQALNDRTAALPLIVPTPELLPGPTQPPFGKDTPHAIAVGVVAAARGMVRTLVDSYAEFYQAYPRIIATGGDAPMLFEHDPLVEVIVPDLVLIGMLEALRRIESLDADA